jgi:phage terminase small subunit
MQDLTAKQAQFVNEYMMSLNGTQAAIRAGYSRKTARAIASENLRKPEIAAEIARRRRHLNEKFDGLIFRVIEELAHIAYATYGDILGPKWGFKPLQEWPPEFSSAVKSVKYREKLAPDGPPGKRQRIVDRLHITTYDKLLALGLLGEYMGIFPRGSARKRPGKKSTVSGFVPADRA